MKKIFLTLIILSSLGMADFQRTNDIVTDNNTTLQWQDDIEVQNHGTESWEDAITYCEGLTLGGHTNWRLPNIKELLSIADQTKVHPALNDTFAFSVTNGIQWSSTTYPGNLDYTYAWTVTVNSGKSGQANKSNSNVIRCVR